MYKIIAVALVVVVAATLSEAGGHASSHANGNLYVYGGHGSYGGYEYDGHQDSYAHPKYGYEYGVHDAHTGDIKTAEEHRDGDVVKGSYSLVEPDGTKRVVEYTADDHNGFNAVVKKIGHAAHPAHYGHGHY